MTAQTATAFAPATVANVGIGFDILGHSFGSIGDRVRANRVGQRGVRIGSIKGMTEDCPWRPSEILRAGRCCRSQSRWTCHSGSNFVIDKGIPLGSGLGGSAASAVAAVVAANDLLDQPLSQIELLKHAIAGEVVASGSAHADNVAPSLFGGLVLTVGIDKPRIKRFPCHRAIRCVLVHPRLFLSTREARAILRPSVNLSDVVWQTANLAGFVAGCFTNDLAMIRDAFDDVIIEPQRAHLIPGFAAGQEVGAFAGRARLLDLGCRSERLCLVRGAAVAGHRRGDCPRRSADHGLACDHWIAAIDEEGARIVERQ